MTGAWQRLGRLELVLPGTSWAVSHAALPVVEPLDEGSWRLYLSVRDGDGRARIGTSRLVMEPAPALTPLDREPALDIGPLGAFDDNGVTSSCLVADGARRLLYYTGWSRGVTVPFYLAAGVAVSERGGPFHRLSPAPLLDRSPADPLLTASPFVLAGRGRWQMWYVSATEWRMTDTGPRHHYHIRYAESDDGLRWRRSGRVAVDYGDPSEHALARPWVVRDEGVHRMWFACRGDRYRIGYAESADGLAWTRRDAAAGLLPAASGWDGDMVAYPCVFDWRGARFMLYNGNGYGRTGVGLARWLPGEGRP